MWKESASSITHLHHAEAGSSNFILYITVESLWDPQEFS